MPHTSAQREHATLCDRLHRDSCVYASLIYAFQAHRLRLLRYWRELYALRKQMTPAAVATRPPCAPLPLYRVVRGPTGYPRLVPAPRVQGAAGDPSFGIAVERTSDGAVITISGEVDLATIPTLRRYLEEAGAPHKTILLDLAALDYLDVSGIRALLNFRRDHEGPLAIFACRPTIHRIMEITGLCEMIPVFPTRERAEAYLRAAGRGESPYRPAPD
jgi:anti-sigma B factor antagonist